jgi:hypothetical protein
MEKEGLELGSFTENVAPEYTVDSVLLSIVSHNLEQKILVTGQMHQNEPWNATFGRL